MKDLIKGLREFQSNYVPEHKELLQELAQGQHPRVLFITCSDSRVQPELITQSDLGDLFVIRNAGNIIPPYGSTNGGEGATIEYAIKSLDIQHIVVCGHTTCGAMKGLLQVGELETKMPLVYNWLKHTEATRELVEEHYGYLAKAEKLSTLVAENVLTQIDNLKTYPSVRSHLHRGEVQLHGWIYNIVDGSVLTYDRANHSFMPLSSSTNEDIQEIPVAYQSNGSSRLSQGQRDRIFRGSPAFYNQ
ncbi:carbonic anhydrase [cf. Phormidesmis sp. LEGE 11477]|uniref:carbonic anhydrase n=1 Tax=cf. Phormidesmis sp. LEGE 11477 TaxID=1828680 RepID=UPI00187E8EE4|nr:carbonic anhydrase [cf. Phormidesmis sp. LEGE 11477]MBE9064294.1 carbonic anhydrase [cf. Phormidesmis sp. LEGE 11477]